VVEVSPAAGDLALLPPHALASATVVSTSATDLTTVLIFAPPGAPPAKSYAIDRVPRRRGAQTPRYRKL
jgi:hypothetical protein